MTNSLSYVPYLIGGRDQDTRVDVIGGLDRGLRVDVMGGLDRGLRVDVMGGTDRGPRVEVIGGPDPARYPQPVQEGAPRSIDFRVRTAKRYSGRALSQATSES